MTNNKATQLHIYSDYSKIRIEPYILAIFLLLSLGGYLMVGFDNSTTWIIKIALGVYLFVITLVVFSFGWVELMIITTKNKPPIAIFDEQGIWTKRYGRVHWKGVEAVKIYQVPGGPSVLQVLAILVKDPQQLYKQSSLYGKISLWCDLKGGYYHIPLRNINIDNQEAVDFANRHMTKKF